MKNQEQITIQKKELPELKKWLEKKNKEILEIVGLENKTLKVIIKK
tara:strand:- start:349 stop:486 length:138 start_codon:yes stop_codon:yes gene_type:complete